MHEPTARHIEIVSAINSFAMEQIGLGRAKVRELMGVSLLEMIEATRSLQNANDAQPDTGARSLWVCPDDRLIAAVYAWLHYASPPYHHRFEQDDVIVSARLGDHVHAIAVCSRPVRSEAANEDEADEVAA